MLPKDHLRNTHILSTLYRKKLYTGKKNVTIAKSRQKQGKKMIEIGKMSLNEIAICSGLSIEKARELAGNKSA